MTLSVQEIKRDILNLVYPSECVGCGAWDEVVCSRCERLLLNPPALVAGPLQAEIGCDFPILGVGEYRDQLRRLVIAGKRSHYLRLGEYFRAAGENLAADLDLPPSTDAEVWVVPAPGRHRNAEAENLSTTFALGVGQGLGRRGYATRVLPALVFTRKVSSQAGRGNLERSENRRHTMGLHPSLLEADVAERGVILVDDILTTGATMREMARVFTEAKAKVYAGAVIGVVNAVFS